MKLILPLTVAAVLSACALTPEDKAALADAAVVQIQAMNDAGVDPVSLPPEQLAVLASGCVLAPLWAPEYAGDIELACKAIQEAAK